MHKIILNAQARKETGKKTNKFRKSGKIPAVVYGNKLESRNLWVDALNFNKTYDDAGESAIVDLSVDGVSANVLIHDVQRNPISGNFTHIDFFQVRMDEEVETEIPVELEGEAPAVKELGGVLVTNLDVIPVSCLPADLPEKFVFDLNKLATFEDRITVGDIKIDEKVKIGIDPETVVALVTPPRAEEELASLDEKVETDVSKVEKIEKKEEPEEAATEEGK